MRSVLLWTLFFIGVGAVDAQTPGQPAQKPFKLFFEKVYLHTDRDVYTVGDDVWFKAYLVNGQTNQLINSSNNLYVELIDQDAKISDRKVIRLDNGLGNGDLHLNDTLTAGIYRLRAYTSWMRNFGDNFICEKTLTILKSEPPAGKPSTLSKKNTVTAAPGTAAISTAQSAAISFFPEGGAMVEGVPGIIACKIENNNRKAASGTILTSTGSTVGAFSCDASGMGTFVLSPTPGEKYIVRGTFDSGAILTGELPAAFSAGFALTIRNTDSLIKVNIATNQATYNQQQGKPLTLTVKSKGVNVYTASVPFNSLQVAFSIVKSGLPPGINAITLLDALGKPQCERLVYVDGTEQANLVISTDQPIYAAKGKVIVKLKTADQHGQPVKANLSLAAVDAGLIPVEKENIISYLNLSSELRGEIVNPSQYFDLNNPRRRQQLDLLLLTQGWRDFLWKRLADSALRISYAAEQGITVAGRVREVKRDAPMAHVNVTLEAPGAANARLFGATTDTLGHYYIDGVVLHGKQSIRLTSRDDKGEPEGMILLDSLFKDSPTANKYIIKNIEDAIPAATENAITARDVNERKFPVNDTTHLKEVKVKGDKFVRLIDQNVTSFGYADEVFNITPKDYDMTDLFHYLQFHSKAQVGDVAFADGGINLRPLKLGEKPPKDTGITYIKLLYYHGTKGSYAFPRLMVNGREIMYTDRASDIRMMADYQQTYFSLPVNKIKKVVIKHMLGRTGGDLTKIDDVYIVYLTLDPGAVAEPWPDRLNANVNGYDEARTFYKPLYPGPSSKPDYRTTIHWEPNIATNQNGEATITYYNADPKTSVRIVAEGVSGSGLPVSGTAVYTVK